MNENNTFVATGARRMIVGLYGISAIGVVHVLAEGGINDPAAYGIGVVTLGYFGSKFAEAVKAFFESKRQ